MILNPVQVVAVCCHEPGLPVWATSHVTAGSVQLLVLHHLTQPHPPLREISKCHGCIQQKSGSLAMPLQPGTHRVTVVTHHGAAAQTW